MTAAPAPFRDLLAAGVLGAIGGLALGGLAWAGALPENDSQRVVWLLPVLGGGAGTALAVWGFGRRPSTLVRAGVVATLAAVACGGAYLGVWSRSVCELRYRNGADRVAWAVGNDPGRRLPSCRCPPADGVDRCLQALQKPRDLETCWEREAISSALLEIDLSYAGLALALCLLAALGWVRLSSGRGLVEAPAGLSGVRLERIIEGRSPFLNVGEWLQALHQHQRRVCRIDVGGRPVGTGFLIGPDLVLTNFHVVAPVASGAVAPSEVAAVFDLTTGPDGRELLEPVRVPLSANGWLVDSSPPSPVDGLERKERDAGADELDHAVLRLGASPGGDRGAVALAGGARPAAGDPMLILQHPEGERLRMTLDTRAVIGVNASGTRIWYRTNTRPGSSGSPCFDLGFRLLALHHGGDARFTPRFNEGIPAGALERRLQQLGLLPGSGFGGGT